MEEIGNLVCVDAILPDHAERDVLACPPTNCADKTPLMPFRKKLPVSSAHRDADFFWGLELAQNFVKGVCLSLCKQRMRVGDGICSEHSSHAYGMNRATATAIATCVACLQRAIAAEASCTRQTVAPLRAVLRDGAAMQRGNGDRKVLF
eukprot:6202276-Pleurochrysis_carterae.AAC.3